MSSRIVYMDGKFIPEAEAKVSIYSLDVMQSAAAFEMTRSFNGVHFKLREHIERLEQSCRLLSLPLPAHEEYRFFVDYVAALCCDLADRNDHGHGEEHRLLIVVSPGAAPIYREIEGTTNHPFLYIADFPLRYTVAGFSKYFTEGVHCVTSNIQQVPDACVPSQAKHRSRLHFHLAQQQAPAGTWPILMNEVGDFTEAPGANIVYVVDGATFSIDHQALPGISLQTVKELAAAQSHGGLAPDGQVDELWLTGTPFCMLPVVSLDGKPIGDGKIGPAFKETLRKWSELVGLDIAAQIISWDAPSPLWTPEKQRAVTV